VNHAIPTEPHLVLEYKIGEKEFLAAGEAASKTKTTLQRLGLARDVVKNVAIIVYEAGMNIVIHAHHGQIKVVIAPEQVVVHTEDEGAGIPNIELAMEEGYSTAPPEVREMGFGAGMGLSNIKKCSDELNIESQPGVGTVVKARIYLDRKKGTA
jgi:serine/threonine-protein kinase RsbT